MNHENLTLTINNDGDTYSARMEIANQYLRTKNLKVAMANMSQEIRRMLVNQSKDFTAAEKSTASINAAASEALEYVVDHLDEGLARQLLNARLGASSPESAVAATAAPNQLTPSITPAPDQVDADGTPLPSRKVSDDVLDVLRNCRVESGKVFLPGYQLERKLYEKVNEVLTGIGGKWKGGKTAAHVFADADPDEFGICFKELQDTGSYTDPKDVEFFRTPPELAAQLIKLVGLKAGMKVMEPNVGDGRIALPAAEIVGLENVHCFELFPPNVKRARDAGLNVTQGDFLSFQPPEKEEDRFDVILMNPPFSNNQDVKHVSHACQFLKKTGRLAAITSESWAIQANNSKAKEFRTFLDASQADVIKVEAGAFKSSGTMVSTQIIVLDAAYLPWNQNDQHDQTHGQSEFDYEEECAADAPAP